LHSSIASSVADRRVVGLPAPAVCSSADAMGAGRVSGPAWTRLPDRSWKPHFKV
jgi:hypothetical protein